MISLCPCCNEQTTSIFSRLLPRSSAFLYKKTEQFTEETNFHLMICNNCGHGYNLDQLDSPNRNPIYSSDTYSVKRSVSTKMSKILKDVTTIIDRKVSSTYPAREKTSVLEIACGSGEVASNLAHLGYKVTTLDPSVDFDPTVNFAHNKRFLDEDFTKRKGETFDVIIARHFLEHVPDIEEVISRAVRLLKRRGLIYLEVPNFKIIYSNCQYYDLFIDHIHYFTLDSISHLLNSHGFTIVDSIKIQDQQHIGVFARIDKAMAYASQKNNDRYLIKQKVIRQKSKPTKTFFSENPIISFEKRISSKFKRLMSLLEGKKIGLYGAGAQSTTFVSWLSPKVRSDIVYVWDKDMSKTGKFLPYVPAPISNLEPNHLSKVDLVVNTAILYRKEIQKAVKSFNKKVMYLDIY